MPGARGLERTTERNPTERTQVACESGGQIVGSGRVNHPGANKPARLEPSHEAPSDRAV
ncbi:MAG: hypothetical protein ACE5I5_00450 [Candidatus Heimdallarchaeota archaeon]